MNRHEILHYVNTIRLQNEVYGHAIDLDALRKRLFQSTRKYPAMINVLEAFVGMRDMGVDPHHILVALEMKLRVLAGGPK